VRGGQGGDDEQEQEDGAGDEDAQASGLFLREQPGRVEGGGAGATVGGVVSHGVVGIEADGTGDGSDEAASVDLAGEVFEAVLFEAFELGDGDAGGAGDALEGQSVLDAGATEAQADRFRQRGRGCHRGS
jgi:hypothetical protein